LEVDDEVQKKIVVVRKKHLTKHGGQTIKQVSKPKRILECIVSPKLIIWEKSQHSGIGPHLLYLILQHYNVSLSFDKIQLTIVK
jgi:hypothetical protein